MRLTRTSMLEVLNTEFVRTARAKGLMEAVVILKYALKNALNPVITVFGLQFAALLGGAFIIEQVFARPGVGGTVLGLASGFAGGRLDTLVMRAGDILLALPGVLFALFVVAMLGPGLVNVMIAVGLAGIPGTARLVRGVTLSIRELEYVTAAKAAGAGTSRLLFRHILPNPAPPILVLISLGIGNTILATAGLSYLGLGAPPPSPEWGAMLMGARDYLRQAWWLSAFPGLFIMLTVLSVNLVGDALRDILDPRLR